MAGRGVPIYLGGGGSESVEVHRAFAVQVGSGRLVYWPFAQAGLNTFEACETWLRRALEPFGVAHIDMWTELSPTRLDELDCAAGLYIGGGNTFRLHEILQSAGAHEAVRSAAHRSLPTYGGSAGASVLGKTIETVLHLDTNELNIADVRGMDLLAGASAWVHYSRNDGVRIARFLESHPGSLLIALPINAGAVVEASTVTATGSSAILLIDSEGEHSLNEGESTALISPC